MVSNDCLLGKQFAELAELVDALDSGSSVRKDFRVQVPGSASFLIKIDWCSDIGEYWRMMGLLIFCRKHNFH